MFYFMLFIIAPTVFELALVLVIFWVDFGLWLVASTVVMVAAYIVFTQKVTDWRNALRARMNDLDTGAVAHRSEEHTSELQSLMRISYAVFCLKKKKITIETTSKHLSQHHEHIIHIHATYQTHILLHINANRYRQVS